MDAPQKTPLLTERTRLTVDLSPPVLSLLDHVSAVTGVSRTQVVAQLLVDALPRLVEHADAIARRSAQLQAPAKGKR